MKRYQFLLETRGLCFFCLRKPPNNNPLGENGEGEFFHSVQKICQYLKLNLREVLSEGVSVLPSSLPVLERSELKGFLCEECAGLSERFSQLHLELEVVRMKLRDCLQSVFGRMVEGERDEETVEEFRSEMRGHPETVVQLGIVERIRKTCKKRCSNLRKRFCPRLVLRRILTPVLAPGGGSLRRDNNIKPFRCELCPVSFARQSMKEDHHWTHHMGKKFTCDLCHLFSFMHRSSRDRHRRTCSRRQLHSPLLPSIPSQIQPLLESVPQMVENGEEPELELQWHDGSSVKAEVNDPLSIFAEEPEPVPPPLFLHPGVTNEVAGPAFILPVSISDPQPVHLAPRLPSKIDLQRQRRTCPYCAKLFSKPWNLRQHISSVYQSPSNFPVFTCKLCGKAFKSKRGRVLHLRSVHLGQRPFQCSSCSMSFTRSSTLQKHRKMHCPLNPATASGTRTKIERERRRRRGRGQGHLQCKFCPGRFFWSGALARHVRMSCPALISHSQSR